MAMFVVKSIHIQINGQVMDLSMQTIESIKTAVYETDFILWKQALATLFNWLHVKFVFGSP